MLKSKGEPQSLKKRVRNEVQNMAGKTKAESKAEYDESVAKLGEAIKKAEGLLSED